MHGGMSPNYATCVGLRSLLKKSDIFFWGGGTNGRESAQYVIFNYAPWGGLET